MDSISIAAPNSIVMVLDPISGHIPEWHHCEPAVLASPSAVSIGTLQEFEGETTFFLSVGEYTAPEKGLVLRWEGEIQMTAERLSVLSAQAEELLGVKVVGNPYVRIWTNHRSEPDAIWIDVES